jgi:hypothetical protein
MMLHHQLPHRPASTHPHGQASQPASKQASKQASQQASKQASQPASKRASKQAATSWSRYTGRHACCYTRIRCVPLLSSKCNPPTCCATVDCSTLHTINVIRIGMLWSAARGCHAHTWQRVGPVGALPASLLEASGGDPQHMRPTECCLGHARAPTSMLLNNSLPPASRLLRCGRHSYIIGH